MNSLNPPNHSPCLDGVRGLAIVLVLMVHCFVSTSENLVGKIFVPILKSGWIGVDLFFVLSGFLITRILISSREKKGYFKNFIMRRALRIFPLYYFSLFLFFVLAPYFVNLTENSGYQELSQDQVYFWLYLQNWKIVYDGGFPGFKFINHFWSLAVEEQFYLVFPFVVFVLPLKKLRWFCLAAFAGTFVLRLVLHDSSFIGDRFTAFSNMFRFDAILIGSFLATLVQEKNWHQKIYNSSKYIFALCALSLFWIFKSEYGLSMSSDSVNIYGLSILALMNACLVALVLGSSDRSFLRNCFSSRVLVFFGKYSYAIYVFHWPIYFMLRDSALSGYFSDSWNFGATLSLNIIGVISVLLTVLASQVTWRAFEQPLLSLKKYFA